MQSIVLRASDEVSMQSILPRAREEISVQSTLSVRMVSSVLDIDKIENKSTQSHPFIRHMLLSVDL